MYVYMYNMYIPFLPYVCMYANMYIPRAKERARERARQIHERIGVFHVS